MARNLTDSDGIDGPFDRAMRKAMREDKKRVVVTADMITDEQIRELRTRARARLPKTRFESRSETLGLIETCDLALDAMPVTTRDDVREFARARCAEILNARTKPSYPHTLTSDQFAIVSVALDGYRDRFKDDAKHLAAIEEVRKLWAFTGPVVLNARTSEPK